MFTYDVFISYSHSDREWIDKALIPRLQRYGVSYSVDYAAFRSSTGVNEEIERAVYGSRIILFVITPHWLTSNFTDFERQLAVIAQRVQSFKHIVFLMVDVHEPPVGFPYNTLISISSDDDHVAWNRLQAVLRSNTDPASRRDGRLVNVALILTKDYDKEQVSGYAYACELHLINMLPGEPIKFDSVLIETLSYAPPKGRSATAVRVFWPLEYGQGQQYGYSHTNVPFAFDEMRREATLSVLELPAEQAVRFPYIRMGPLRTTIAGQTLVGCTARVLLGANDVGCKCFGVLPPVNRLSRAQSTSPGFVLETVPEWYFSSGSGVCDPVLRETILSTAYRHAQDALLVRVAPRMIILHSFGEADENHLHQVEHWEYAFYSDTKGGFQISARDPTWVNLDDEPFVSRRPAAWLSATSLQSVRLDGNWAYLMPLHLNVQPRLKNYQFGLEMTSLSGQWRPVWWLPFEQNGQVGITADSAEMVVNSGLSVEKVPGVVWNA